MHKLVILVESTPNDALFEAEWYRFLYWAEQMPGLRREVTSRRTMHMFGSYPCLLIHELHFDTKEAVQIALASEAGNNAGKTLQEITKGKVTLFIAEHLEDTIENIRAFSHEEKGDEPGDDA